MNETGRVSLRNRLEIEEDMVSRKPSETAPFLEKVFSVYPLIGNCQVKEETFSKMYENARKMIDALILDKENKREQRTVTMNLHEQIVLVTVFLARNWNSSEEGRFTRYIAMQFGHPSSDAEKVWGAIKPSIEIAFTKNKRFFIKRQGDRQFFETIMAHSLGPGKTWYSLFDLLFDFYTCNLNWNYIPNDPLFQRLVLVLQGYFNNDVQEEDNFLIASKSYSLRVGIRRLVQERPGYCISLFEKIVNRINQLVHNEQKESKAYYSQLIDMWFAERISKATINENQKTSKIRDYSDIALSYSTINVRYVLEMDEIYVKIPAIRLQDENIFGAKARLYLGNQIVKEVELSTYGNELGQTINAATISLRDILSLVDGIQLRVEICVDDEVLYDSEKRLWRSVIFFSDGKEIGINRIKKEKYQLFVPRKEQLVSKNAELLFLDNCLCDISLHKNFSLLYQENVLAEDYSDIQEMRVVKPEVVNGVKYVENEISYHILQDGAVLSVYVKEYTELKKYVVVVNGIRKSLYDYFDEFSGNRAVIQINKKNEPVSLSIINLSSNNVIYRDNYYLFESFSYNFSQKYYLGGDNVFASLSYYIGNKPNTVNTLVCGGEVSTQCGAGELFFDVPIIDYAFSEKEKLLLDKYFLAENVTSTSAILFNNMAGIPYCVKVSDYMADSPSMILLTNAIEQSNLQEKGTANIELIVDGTSLCIGVLVFRGFFINPPVIDFKNGELIWDGGVSYIGNKDNDLILTLTDLYGESQKHVISFGRHEICCFVDREFADGEYVVTIEDSCTGDLLHEGYAFIGNASKARFWGKRILVSHISEDIEIQTKPIAIKDVYIEKINLVGDDPQYVQTEDDYYDVYSGVMYWVSYSGDKHYYSFKYDEKKSKYKVNPVKIIYINDKYLRVVNEDDEGIYCYYNEDSRIPGYEITDVEPSARAKGYKDILFYLFSTEEVKKKREEKKMIQEEASKRTIIITSGEKKKEKLNTNRNERPKMSLQTAEIISQKAVIEYSSDARLLINAGPGTGKTWTLIEKIIYLIEEQHVQPDRIEVLCFSRAAVEVIHERISEAIQTGRVDISANYVDIRTFDSFASQLLYWVKGSNYSEISKSFDIERLSYDERIAKFCEVIKSSPELISQCDHLIVDEVQDLVSSRADMVLSMISSLPRTSGVSLFGDACQSIYDYQVSDSMTSSRDFYAAIENDNFIFFTFDKNFRQCNELQTIGEKYRKEILHADVFLENKCLKEIKAFIPEYDEPSINKFNEDSLDRIMAEGKIGILTRSNAQALIISGIFRKKNISHVVQRRLEDNSLSGWIAYVFNSDRKETYSCEEFISVYHELADTSYLSDEELNDVWNSLTEYRQGTTGRVPVRELLMAIRNGGKNGNLYPKTEGHDVTISTIHRSKGREYDSVLVLDSLISNETEDLEEHRVNYVALTRAKSRIYSVSLKDEYFRMLQNRRCYSWGFGGNSKHYLKYIEFGKDGDIERRSFTTTASVQKMIRQEKGGLIESEVYLQLADYRLEGEVVYNLVLRKNGMILAHTSLSFALDLNEAIRETKNLPWNSLIFDCLYPKRFCNLYVVDVVSDVNAALGEEKDIYEYGEMISWNSLLVSGYGKAEY